MDKEEILLILYIHRNKLKKKRQNNLFPKR